MPPTRASKPVPSLGRIPRASSRAVHNVMVSNRGRDTKLELKLRGAIREAGNTGYRVSYKAGKIRLDLAFPRRMVGVLIHGCFWHSCPICRLPLPKTHQNYWARKFIINRARDQRVREALKREGWNLIEIWEHEVKDNLQACVEKVGNALSKAPKVNVSA